jgi:hypothetical protein
MEPSPPWDAKSTQSRKKFPALYATRFIIAFRSARYWSPSWAPSCCCMISLRSLPICVNVFQIKNEECLQYIANFCTEGLRSITKIIWLRCLFVGLTRGFQTSSIWRMNVAHNMITIYQTFWYISYIFIFNLVIRIEAQQTAHILQSNCKKLSSPRRVSTRITVLPN